MTDLERPAPFNVEEIFNQFVKEIDGELISNIITDTNETPNADYIFKNKNIIAELKCFQKDIFGSNDTERFITLLESWTKKGLSPELTFPMLVNGQFPIEFKSYILQVARKSIDSVIRKANRQIRETKKAMNMPKAIGLVLLCNDGNYFLENNYFFGLICNLMENKYQNSEIDGFVYFTVNQTSRSSEDELDYNVWLPAYRKQADDKLVDFVDQLGSKFMNEFYTKLTGIAPSKILTTDNFEVGIKEIKKLKYLPKDIAYKRKGSR